MKEETWKQISHKIHEVTKEQWWAVDSKNWKKKIAPVKKMIEEAVADSLESSTPIN